MCKGLEEPKMATCGTASAAANAPVSLQTLANYLTRDFWLEAGTNARRYNLSSGGTGAKNGIITYNVTGWRMMPTASPPIARL